ncbi:MAG: hypothetical protein AB1813_20610, partial [Verrucomicrobiota bacterium]
AIVLSVSLLLLKDTIVKTLVENRIRAETGMDVKIGRIEVGLVSPTVNVEHLRLYNRAEFGGSPFAIIPDLYFEYDPDAFREQKLRFKLIRIHLEELNIVQSDHGTNLVRLMESFPELTGSAAQGMSRLGAFAGIDTLNLTLGKVRRFNLNAKTPPEEYNWNLRHQILTNVKSPDDLENLLWKISFQRGITVSTGGRVQIESPNPTRSEPHKANPSAKK